MMNMQVRIKMYWKKKKDLFELIKQDGVTQSQVDEKNDALNKAQKNFQNKFKDYSKAMNTVNKRKTRC